MASVRSDRVLNLSGRDVVNIMDVTEADAVSGWNNGG
jgi:hypothetical protein